MSEPTEYTGYVIEGISIPLANNPTIHQVTFRMHKQKPIPHGGTLELDPNTCGLDEFATPKGCTHMATETLEITLRELQTDGNGNKILFAVHSDKKKLNLRVVSIPDPRAPGGPPQFRLLALGKDGNTIEKIVNLLAG